MRYAAEPLAVFLAAFALYAATPSANLGAAHDGVVYLAAIEAGRDPFHPHHLLYQPAAMLWLDAWRRLGVDADGARVVGLLGSLFGALAVAAFFAVLRRRLGLELGRALAGAALAATSFGLWFYSVTVEVYTVPLVFLVGAFYALAAPRPGPRAFAAAGLLHGLAVLFHQSHLLFAGVSLAAAWLARRDSGAPTGRLVAAYVAALVPTAALPYALVVVGEVRPTSVTEAWRWLTLYAHHSPSFWRPPDLATPARVAAGLGRAFVGGHFAFALPAARELAAHFLDGHWLADEAFLVRDMGVGTARALLALAAAFAAAVAILTARAASWRPRGAIGVPGPGRTVLVLAVAWIVPYGAFFAVWQPTNVEFWIAPSLALWLFVLAVWARAERGRSRPVVGMAGMGALALVLLGVNYAGSIRLLADPANDYYRAVTAPLAAEAAPGDLIVIGREWILAAYLERATDVPVMSLDVAYAGAGDPDAFVRRVGRAVDATLARGQRVVLSDEALHLDPETVRRAGPGILAVGALLTRYGSRLRTVAAPGGGPGTIHVIEPEPRGLIGPLSASLRPRVSLSAALRAARPLSASLRSAPSPRGGGKATDVGRSSGSHEDGPTAAIRKPAPAPGAGSRAKRGGWGRLGPPRGSAPIRAQRGGWGIAS